MTQTLLAAADLTTADRCDRCGAQAFFRAVLAAGELLFCAHHGREYGARLARGRPRGPGRQRGDQPRPAPPPTSGSPVRCPHGHRAISTSSSSAPPASSGG